MALYRHVPDKDALLVLVLNALYERLPRPRLPRNPRGRLIALWSHLHDGLARYPWVVDALLNSDTIATAVLPDIEAILEASLAAGLTLEQAARLYRMVWHYTVGALPVVQQATLSLRTIPQKSVVLRTMIGTAARFPLLGLESRAALGGDARPFALP